MTIAERVNALIAGGRPAAFCDDCITNELDLSRDTGSHRQFRSAARRVLDMRQDKNGNLSHLTSLWDAQCALCLWRNAGAQLR
jgi:hypothetical protein